MTAVLPIKKSQLRVPFIVSFLITLIMGILFTLLDVLQPPDPFLSIMAFMPGTVSILFLRISGSTRTELNLRLARISLPGLATLSVTTLLLLPILTSSTAWLGFRWLPALVYAPASGIAQEVYFRSSLLPALEKKLNNRKTIALSVHSVMFVGFHFRTFQSIPSVHIALIVSVVLFLAGCGWGRQVQKDRTVVWAILQHSIFLVLMSTFDWT